MAKGSSTNTSSTNTSFSPSMNFGAPTPGEVANNAGLGPFGTVNWGSGPSSTTPTKDNAAEVANKPTTPTVDTSNFAPVEGKGAVVSEEVFANNPVENAAVESDFSWVTDSSTGKLIGEIEPTHWDNKAEQAREIAGYNQRKARNRTYEGDWRARTVIPKYDKERKYDKFIAPLEMNKAWKEANENIVAKNNIESISNALKAAGKDAGKINPEVAKEFDIGGKVGKNFKDVEKDRHEAFRNYEAAKALKDADKEKEAKEALEKSNKAMREQIALENKVANETMNEFIEMVNKPDVPGLGKGIDKSALEYNNTKIGDMTVYVTKSDVDENAVNVTFVTPDGREVDVGQVGTEGYAGSFSNESLASRRDALKSQIDLIEKAYEKSLSETPVETTPEVTPETKEETPEEATIAPEVTPETKEETPEEATIAPEVTPETKEVTLNDIEEEINNIDVSKIESIKQAQEVNAKIDQTFANLEVTARNQLETLVTDLVNEGKSLQAIRESPAFKTLATQIFRVAQNIYDKVNDVDEYTNRYLGDIDISSKRSIKKNADKISMRIDQMENKISPYMSKEDINALAKYSKSVDSTKDAAIALMKAAAFNGAENVKGDFWSDAYKAEQAEVKGGFKEGGKDLAAKFFGGKDSGKLTWGDWAAASIKGTAGVTATILGFAMMGINPVAGTMLALSGIKTAAETGMKMALDVTRSKSTNEEAMFGSGENYVGKTIMNNIYNRSFEEANIGDPKSVATYTTVANMLRSLVEISTGNNLNIISAINTLKDGISNLAHGGMKGRTDALVNNVFALSKNIVEWADMNPNIISGISSEKGNNNGNNNYNNPSTSYNFITDDIIEENKKPAKVVENMGSSTSFGVESGSAEAAASTYSGAKEQAKNSNLATDYNAGMEQEVNEAVSDKRVKGYIVKIYGSEPDFIRNAISKILTAHSEREWK